MDKNKLREVILDQQEEFKRTEELIDRDLDLDYFLKGNEIIIISGIRRCGKSSLLKIISKRINGFKLFLNFDDLRLTDFNIENFQDMENISFELFNDKKVAYFLDEIQNVKNWERWVNNLHSKNLKVFITGSNSELLSSEISTFLTGRNKVIKLAPFSFKEFLAYKGIAKTKLLTTFEKNVIFNNFLKYFELGGFPVIVKNDDVLLSKQYFEDILNKDVLNRYRINQVKELKDLILYLFSNPGRTYSYSALKQVSKINSLSTIKNYIDYFRNVFLVFTVERFDYSVKKQKISSSKIYLADNSFFKTISFNFSENLGKRLENLVFLELIKKNREVYYHFDKKECDFVVKKGLKIIQATQVSLKLDSATVMKREIEGLKDAMKKYDLKEGLILTLEDEKTIKEGNLKIMIKPVWKWLLEN
jgi:uncharacterized protein